MHLDRSYRSLPENGIGGRFISEPRRPRSRLAIAVVAALLPIAGAGHSGPPGGGLGAAPVYELINGRWYDGSSFVRKTMWTVEGRFAAAAPPHVDSVIDLSGGFVVPPFAEAHTHNIGCPPTTAEATPYVRDGIQFVMVHSNTFPERSVTPSTSADVDVVCAGAVLTPPGSHITRINEQSADRGNFPGLTRADLDGRTHVLINTRDDIDRKLGRVLAERPAFIKIVLAFSEEWSRRSVDSAFIGKRGLDPRLVPLIVQRAHAAGVKVSAHIESAADFRLAVTSGVDFVAHLPGLRIGQAAGFVETDTTRWLLTDADARDAAAHGVTVATTVVAARALMTPATQASSERASISAVHHANVATLRRHAVRLVVGSDLYDGTSLIEALMLGRAPLVGGGIVPLGFFDNADLLLLWSMDTPRAIFPTRRIGALDDGYEANLLVLAGNPIDDFGNVRRITFRMKAGRIVH